MFRILPIILAILMVAPFSGCKDACEKAGCVHDVYCVEGQCFCEEWYSGEQCDLKYNRNYSGDFEGSYQIDGARNAQRITLYEDLVFPNRIWFEGEVPLDFVDDSLLMIQAQQINVNDTIYLVSGEGKYDLDYLQIAFTRTHQDSLAFTENVSFTGFRVVDTEGEE